MSPPNFAHLHEYIFTHSLFQSPISIYANVQCSRPYAENRQISSLWSSRPLSLHGYGSALDSFIPTHAGLMQLGMSGRETRARHQSGAYQSKHALRVGVGIILAWRYSMAPDERICEHCSLRARGMHDRIFRCQADVFLAGHLSQLLSNFRISG